MAAENNDNVILGNGNVPTTTEQQPTPKAGPGTAEGILTTIILTLWDVVVFLSISIGYIFQVSTIILEHFVHRIRMFSYKNRSL